MPSKECLRSTSQPASSRQGRPERHGGHDRRSSRHAASFIPKDGIVPTEACVAAPGPRRRTVRTAEGEVVRVPDGWQLLPPGDAALTRRVKAAGPAWVVREKKGRRVFSHGVWADAGAIALIRAELEAERLTPAYERKRQADRARRERKQEEYVGSFCEAVVAFLAFAPAYAEVAERLARAVTEHATPVGSGTVARTQRIPIAKRAEAAVIAWLRHQTTAYDSLKIPRVKGERRAVRRRLAAESKRLLAGYRAGRSIDPAACPLQQALGKASRKAAKATKNPAADNTGERWHM